MESTKPRVSLDDLADAVVAKLTQSGRLANLAEVDLETLEDQVVGSIDQLTRSGGVTFRTTHRSLPRISKTPCQSLANPASASASSQEQDHGRSLDFFRTPACCSHQNRSTLTKLCR